MVAAAPAGQRLFMQKTIHTPFFTIHPLKNQLTKSDLF
jgi:hypothetical protein